MKRIIQRYELTDAEWERLQPYFPERQMGDKGRPRREPREMLNGIFWIARSGAVVRVDLDGQAVGHILYPPYQMPLGAPDAGKHELTLTLLGNRENTFGPIHRADTTNSWIGPDAWRTENASWTDSYRLTALGLRTAPKITEEE